MSAAPAAAKPAGLPDLSSALAVAKPAGLLDLSSAPEWQSQQVYQT